MKQDDIKNTLLKNKNYAMILYVLSQIPSYTQELTSELNIDKHTVENAICYLKENKLIRILDINSAQNESIGNLYPLLLKKLNKIQSSLPPNKAKSVLKNLKFYYISKRGTEYLPSVREILFEMKKGEKK